MSSTSIEPTPTELEGFEIWFDKWMDLDAARHEEGEIYGQTIHSSRIDIGIVEVDFGSATTVSVTELLEIFLKNGVEVVGVSSGKNAEVER